MKTTWVYFTENNARVIVNPGPAQVAALAVVPAERIVKDPDLSQVKGVAPHFWKLEGGAILPMTPEEQAVRLQELAPGVDNVVPPAVPAPVPVDERGRIAKAWSSLGRLLRGWR